MNLMEFVDKKGLWWSQDDNLILETRVCDMNWPIIKGVGKTWDNSGGFSTVFMSLEDNSKVVKVFNKYSCDCVNEFFVQKRAYELGISCPKPHFLGLINSGEKRNRDFLYYPILVMDYVEGVTPTVAMGPGMEDVLELYSNEIKKAKSLGFIPGDNYLHNSIYNFENNKITLIDFGLWRFER